MSDAVSNSVSVAGKWLGAISVSSDGQTTVKVYEDQVGDDPVNRAVLRAFLQPYGFCVWFKRDGAEIARLVQS